MDVALIISIENLHTRIIPSLEKIQDATCRLLKIQYVKDDMSKGNFLNIKFKCLYL